jgi:predicted DsbA family dithiol-disulfide isomerase
MTDHRAAESTIVIDLDLWGDIVDPWSWVTKRRVEEAIAAFERPHDVRLRLRAFELDPGLEAGSHLPVTDQRGYVPTKIDHEPLVNWGIAVRANSFDAHRLCALALEMGGLALQGAAVERFHAAHFREGLAIDDHEVLQRTAAEAGLDERRVAAVLAGHAYADHVRRDEGMARALGVTSVPFLLANDSAMLAGQHPVEDYLAFLRQVATTPV